SPARMVLRSPWTVTTRQSVRRRVLRSPRISASPPLQSWVRVCPSSFTTNAPLDAPPLDEPPPIEMVPSEFTETPFEPPTRTLFESTLMSADSSLWRSLDLRDARSSPRGSEPPPSTLLLLP